MSTLSTVRNHMQYTQRANVIRHQTVGEARVADHRRVCLLGDYLVRGRSHHSMTTELAQRMWNANVRIEKMFWIAGICAAPPSDFEEFIENDLAGATEVLNALPWLSEPNGEAEDVLAEFAFRNIDGFLVHLATPIPRDFDKGGSGYSFTWGHLRTEWFFFPTIDAICERAETWASQVVEKARKKAAIIA